MFAALLAFPSFISFASAALPGNWPAAAVKVAPVPEWSAMYVNQIDTAPSLPIITVCNGQKDWAATWDDGPSPQTPRVLDALKQRNAKATFFVVGPQVVRYPEILKRAYDEGHQIALHTWSHSNLRNLTNDEIIAEVMWNIKAVKDAIGVSPKYLRPPQGEWDDRVHKVLNAMGVHLAMWTPDRDTNDWQITANPALIQPMMTNVGIWVKTVRPQGPISLHHDIAPIPVDYAAPIINSILDNGFNMVQLGTCLSRNDWYSDAAPNMNVVGVSATSTTSSDSNPSSSSPGKTPTATRAPSGSSGQQLNNASFSLVPHFSFFVLLFLFAL